MAGTIKRVFGPEAIVAAADAFSQAYRGGLNETSLSILNSSPTAIFPAVNFLLLVTNYTGGTWLLTNQLLYDEDGGGGTPIGSGVVSAANIVANGLYRMGYNATFAGIGDALPNRVGRWNLSKTGVGNHDATFTVYSVAGGGRGGTLTVVDRQTGLGPTTTFPLDAKGGHASAMFFVRTRTGFTGTWDITLRLNIAGNTIDIATVTGLAAANVITEIVVNATDFKIQRGAIPAPNEIVYNEAAAGTFVGDVFAFYGD